ncbi:MAG: Lrp/AsnC family transcriptional regulator [Kiritimatiellae bacterium]|nr:Lrp/AsnC family transcriptional regulator [Kiritimatiellia bacterium]
MRTSRTIDELDIRIAHELGKDGRLSNRELARRLGISEGSVRQRLGRLVDGGVLRVTAQANLESQPDAFLAIVGVKLDGRRLTECAKRIAKLPSVLTTMIVTGRHDLMAVILAPSRRTLVDFVTSELSTVPGVRESETSVVLKSLDFWVDSRKMFTPHLKGTKTK